MFFVKVSKYNKLNEQKKELENQKSILQNRCELLENRNYELDKYAKHLHERYRKSNSSKGGLTKQNNYLNQKKKQMDHDIKILQRNLEIEQKNSQLKENTILKMTRDNNKLVKEITQLQGIVDNLNKLIQKKMKPGPTAIDIMNYDRKYPIKK